MHCPSFPILLFSVAVAELLTDSDPAFLPDLVPPTLPNSPSPIPITPDTDLNLVAATPSEMFSLDSKVAQEPSKDMETETSTEPATIDTNTLDAGNSVPACNSVRSASGRKLRREQGEQCAPEVPWQTRIKDFLHQLAPNPDPPPRKPPKGALTEEELRAIWNLDLAWDGLRHDDPYWETHGSEPCQWGDPQRPISGCCMGPPRPRPQTPLAFAADAPPIVDLENCVFYVQVRPWCTSLIGPVAQVCCEKIDIKQRTFRGYLGIDCVPMWAGWGPDGLRLRVDP